MTSETQEKASRWEPYAWILIAFLTAYHFELFYQFRQASYG